MSLNDDTTYCDIKEGKMALPYQYFAGAIGSKFIVALRDEKKILAVKSQKTGKTYLPPRQVDDRSFEYLGDNWVEVGETGEVVNFTVIRYEEPYQPQEPPYVLALIKLEGADTPLVHVLDRQPDDAVIGMKVRAKFAEVTANDILGIEHFTPV